MGAIAYKHLGDGYNATRDHLGDDDIDKATALYRIAKTTANSLALDSKTNTAFVKQFRKTPFTSLPHAF
jgi:hypothetical protein